MSYTAADVEKMDYVSFMGFLNETNRPPGGKDSIRRMAINSFLSDKSKILHSGCNTGYCSFELCHLVKAEITAIDINDEMLKSAQSKLEKEPLPYRNLMEFKKGDAHLLEFKDNSFDLVMSGGSTAFMSDKSKVVQEYSRVCKLYGFVGDIFLYYHKKPPASLVSEINKQLKIDIKVWDLEYWTSLYTNEGLELFYLYNSPMPVHPTKEDVANYCREITNKLDLSNEAKEVAFKKLNVYMLLFNENNDYLSYGVLLCRKVAEPEQVNLFGN